MREHISWLEAQESALSPRSSHWGAQSCTYKLIEGKRLVKMRPVFPESHLMCGDGPSQFYTSHESSGIARRATPHCL